jgi:hypothetical protein
VNRTSAAEHRWPERESARLVEILDLLGFGGFLRFCSGRLFGLGRSRLRFSGRSFGLRRGGDWRRSLGEARACRGLSMLGPVLSRLFVPGRLFVPVCRFRNCGRGPIAARGEWSMGFAAVIATQLIGLVFVDRAGVGDLFGDTEFVQLVDDLARLYF